MNLPNRLTVSRFALTGLFWVAVFAEFPGNRTCALLLFGLASLTDYLDGKIARERRLITDFGTLMDPLADKILTCSAFIPSSSWTGSRPGWWPSSSAVNWPSPA